MVFYFISAPLLFNNEEGTKKELREVVLRNNISKGWEMLGFDKTKFKLANLDTLMFCNDKILKLENLVESFLKRIDKQFL